MNSNHLKFINEAHSIAAKKFGSTYPNPVVGCVIVKNNKIISKGVTNKTGRPHAEEIAINKAGLKTKGATMYVTLEPCNHNSNNGSCTDQILRSGIKEIFISSLDPDERTNGKSIRKLKLNKINTHVGIQENKTQELFSSSSSVLKAPAEGSSTKYYIPYMDDDNIIIPENY